MHIKTKLVSLVMYKYCHIAYYNHVSICNVAVCVFISVCDLGGVYLRLVCVLVNTSNSLCECMSVFLWEQKFSNVTITMMVFLLLKSV